MNHTKETDRVSTLFKGIKQELDNKLFLAMHEMLHMEVRIQELEATEDELCAEINDANLRIHKLEAELDDNYRSEETRLLAAARAISPPHREAWETATDEAIENVLAASGMVDESTLISTPPITTGLYCTECYREVLERDFDFTHGMCLGCYAKEKQSCVNT